LMAAGQNDQFRAYFSCPVTAPSTMCTPAT
jgi:hypothetical protein